jgi:Leucine-rich repeat (LRR) protein
MCSSDKNAMLYCASVFLLANLLIVLGDESLETQHAVEFETWTDMSFISRLDERGQKNAKKLIITSSTHNISKFHFEGLVNLTELVLSGNDISFFPEGVFDDLTRLETLDLRQNKAQLPADIFAKLTHLKRLDLSSNDIKGFDQGVFGSLSNLRSLDISNNLLKSLPKGLFEGLEVLEILCLDDNPIGVIDPQVFFPLLRLRNLHLREVSIVELPIGLFAKNLKLEIVVIVSNANVRMKKLPDNFFNNMASLKMVELQCGLEALPDGLFHGSSNVEELYLKGNYLTNLPATLLRGQNKLKKLDLSENRLERIEGHFLDETVNLSELNLGCNRLAEIPE